MTIFQTERLTVRKFSPDDWEDLAEILTDPEVTYFEPYETFTKEACVQEAFNFSKSDEFFAVVLNEKVIGKIYFSDRQGGKFEVGYTFNKAFQGKGFAFESVGGMIKYAFDKMGVQQIIAQIDPRNTKSINLVERLGLLKNSASCHEKYLTYEIFKSQ